MPTNVELNIKDVTDGSLDGNNNWKGTGIFDVLMEAVNENIASQYMKNRITGSDFANVYLGSVQAVLQQSVEYSLRKSTVEAELRLTEERIKLTYVERVLKDKEAADLGHDQVVKDSNTNPAAVYQPKYTEL
jgi:hypothetical protein